MLENIAESRRWGELEFFIETRGRDRVVSRMPVTEGIKNPFGLVQAGAMIWLADVTATVLVLENSVLEEGGRGFPLAVDLHTTLLSNQREGEIRAEARPVRLGRRVSVVRTSLTGEGGRLLAEVTTTHVPAG